MATTETRRFYELTDTANTQVNEAILKQELIDAGLPCTDVLRTGTSFACVFNDNLSDAEVATADTTVGDHEGDAFVSTNPEEVTNGPGDHDLNTWQAIGSGLDVGPLPAGDYLVGATLEIALLSTAAGVGVQAHLTVNSTEVAIDSWDLAQWHRCNLSYKISLDDGATASIALEYQRSGASGTGVQFRRARLSVTPIDAS